MPDKKISWENRGVGVWVGYSARFGRVKIQKGRATKRWYLMSDALFESPFVLGDYPTREAAQAAAE